MSEGFFGFLPKEMAQVMQQQRDQQMMVAEAEGMAIDHLFDNLDPDDLATLRGIFHDMVGDDHGRLAAYYEGLAVTMLRIKHNRCPGCGKPQHDSVEVLLDEHNVTGADSDGSEQEKEGRVDEQDDDAILKQPGPDGTASVFADADAFSSKPQADVYVDPSKELIGQKGLLTADMTRQMIEYNLDDLRDEDTGAILGFICLNCRVKYPSIADRMLNPPDECSGCQQKSKWG